MSAIPQGVPESAPSPHRRAAGAAGGPLGWVVLALFLAALLWAVAVAATPESSRVPVAWCTGVAGALLTAGVAVAGFRIRSVERARSVAANRAARLESDLAQVRAEMTRASEETLPWVLERVRARASAPTILADLSHRDPPQEPAVRGLVDTVVQTLHQERRTLNAALAVLQDCSHRVQAAVNGQQAEIDQRQAAYWQEDTATVSRQLVRADFEALDARLAHMGLLAQRLLALTGARRTGRPWPKPVAVERVLRAAMGPNEDYQRVQLILPPEPVAVAGPAVNAAMHVLSEVIDNALRYSPPTTQVRVTAEDVPAGVITHVDDSGLRMNEDALARARRTVDPEHAPDITMLSGNRLGLAAARVAGGRFGIQITFSPSPSGGTRASVWIPRQWLGTAPAEQGAVSAGRAAPRTRATPPSPPAAPTPATHPEARLPSPEEATLPATPPEETAPAGAGEESAPAVPPSASTARSEGTAPAVSESTAKPRGSKLPKRRPGSTMPEPSDEVRQAPSAAPTPTLSPQETGRRMSSFRHAVRGTSGTTESSEN